MTIANKMPDLPKPRKSIRYTSEEADAIRRHMEAYKARILEEERNIQQMEKRLAQLEHDKAKATQEVKCFRF